MRHFVKRIAVLTTTTMLSLSLTAFAVDQIYVKNRPFKGVVATAGGQVWVELSAFAQALGANLVSNDQGGHALSLSKLAPEAAKDIAANMVMVDGVAFEARSEGEIIVVPLESTAKALKAKVVHNKAMGTVDVNLGGPAQAAPAEPSTVASKTDGKAGKDSNILRVTGRITLGGADAVGLFEGGSASVPYKVGKVDKKGNYVMEIDLSKDLHGGITDMRFYKEGAFEVCHGRCNFIRIDPKTRAAVLSPYGSEQEFTSKDGQLVYTESDQ